MNITAYDIAERYVGIREIPGSEHNPAILSMLRLDMEWPEGDEVPWCSAFVNYVAWLLRLPRSKSLRARSWLRVGTPVPLSEAQPGFDVVILSRGGGNQPGPDVIEAPGHVGFYAGRDGASLHLLGGNQGDSVSVAPFGSTRLLGIRRLARDESADASGADAVSQNVEGADPPMLRKGSQGVHVEWLQRLLREHQPDVQPDGIYGPRTEAAVRDFQAAHGLTVDGVAGPETWTRLLFEEET